MGPLAGLMGRMAEYHICSFGVLYRKVMRQVIEESVESRREMHTYQYLCLSEGLPMRYCAPVEYDYSRYLNDRRAAGGWLYPTEERERHRIREAGRHKSALSTIPV